MADSDNGRFYLWDRPEDPGHFVYEKISWVRHFKGFVWHIASSVRRIQEGGLTARSGIQQEDEIGLLSTAFDGMVVRLQDNMDNLDSNSVRERTAEL